MANDKRPKTKVPILILHGWARTMTGDKYYELIKLLQKEGYAVYSPDLPGFGREKLVKNPMTLNDYVFFVRSFLKNRKISKVIVIGHSFGGRIGAVLASQYPKLVEKLIISGSPLIKHKPTIKKRLAFIFAKSGKFVIQSLPDSLQYFFRKLLYRGLGEWDYFTAGELKATMRKIIAYDVAPVLPLIAVPTLVLWGEEDKTVSISDGLEIAKRIKRATFVSIKNAGHRVPYENPTDFAMKVLAFIQ
ncbi:MAG: alpha/beta hydrolase [Candidatus Levybacteria bacterium]|nr:alpha/beta hydrolase [Candidatus Levybacteria bacterium]